MANATERQLARLKQAASTGPDPLTQAAYLRALSKIRPDEVVNTVEKGDYGTPSPEVATEYVRALSQVRALKSEKVPHILSVLKSLPAAPAFKSSSAISSGSHMSAAPGAKGASAAPWSLASWGARGGTTPNITTPLQVALAEPSLQSQLWRLVRVIGSTFLLLGFLGVLMEERGGGALSRIKTDAEPEPESDDPVSFSDVAGANEAKAELIELVEYLRDPASFTRLGGKVPSGVLLVGPPGTGKTLLAKAVAGEARVPFFFASGSSFEEMYVGVGAKRVRELFAAAKTHAPSIVFVDEIDALASRRSPRDASYVKLAFFELLQALDGFRSSESVIVIAATNNPESLDPALVRPGRFDRHIMVPNPDRVGRQDILRVHSKKVPLSEDVNLDVLARGTPGFSGADLANLVNSAAVQAAVDKGECVSMRHLEEAKDKILMGPERRSSAISEDTRRLTALHEGGHAITALFTEGALPVHKATIVPRGSSLGMVAQLPDKDESSMSRRQMLARLVVCMGGRVAEELVMGSDKVTSGAQSDFAQATRLAEAMVTQFGLSERLGPMVYERDTESPETRALIEAEMKCLLEAAYKRATTILSERSADLHNVARALLDRETLTGEEVRLAAAGKLPPLPIVDPEEHVASVSQGSDLLGIPEAASIPSAPRLSNASPQQNI